MEKDIILKALPKEQKEEWIKDIKDAMKEEVEKMVRYKVIKPIELILLREKWLLDEEEYKRLKGKVMRYEYIKGLIENEVWRYKESKKRVKLKVKVGKKERVYEVEDNRITEDELRMYKDIWIINEKEYEELKAILEKKGLKEKEEKMIQKTKKDLERLKETLK